MLGTLTVLFSFSDVFDPLLNLWTQSLTVGKVDYIFLPFLHWLPLEQFPGL